MDRNQPDSLYIWSKPKPFEKSTAIAALGTYVVCVTPAAPHPYHPLIRSLLMTLTRTEFYTCLHILSESSSPSPRYHQTINGRTNQWLVNGEGVTSDYLVLGPAQLCHDLNQPSPAHDIPETKSSPLTGRNRKQFFPVRSPTHLLSLANIVVPIRWR